MRRDVSALRREGARQVTYAEHLARNGGLATCGNHLGVMVGPEPARCPAGWVFVPQAEATPEIVQEALNTASRGRKDWPEKDAR